MESITIIISISALLVSLYTANKANRLKFKESIYNKQLDSYQEIIKIIALLETKILLASHQKQQEHTNDKYEDLLDEIHEKLNLVNLKFAEIRCIVHNEVYDSFIKVLDILDEIEEELDQDKIGNEEKLITKMFTESSSLADKIRDVLEIDKLSEETTYTYIKRLKRVKKR